MSVSRTVSEVFSVKWCDLEIWVRGRSRSWKWYHSKALVRTVSYSHSIVTMAISCIIPEIKWDIGGKLRFFYPCIRCPS